MLRQVGRFLREELWQRELRGWRGFWIGALRVTIHAFGSFHTNLGSIRAAGLSLITLLAIVPVLALVTAIARAFAYGDEMKAEITRYAAENLSPPLQEAVSRIQALAEATNFKTIGVIGTLVLAYAGFELFTRVEQAFNAVWKSQVRRKWIRRLSDFIALVMIVPILVLGALSLNSLLQGARLNGLREKYVWVRWIYEAGLGFVPHLLMWLALTALYKAMPSAKVAWKAATVGAIVAGSGWVALHGLYIHFQIGVAQFNAIYATLAILPLLIVYLQLTWTILLLGAEVAYGVQNVDALRKTRTIPPATHAIRRRLALLLMTDACRKFSDGSGGCNLHEIAVRCDVPREWVDDVFRSLSDAGLLARLANSEQAVPGRPPAQITTLEVMRALESGEANVFSDQIPLEADMEARLKSLAAAEKSALDTGFACSGDGQSREPRAK
jgi:membrane protein